jgi:hypothetical protein
MIGLLCFALAVLASPFKSKVRLEAEIARHGHQGQAYRTSLALAEWLCRTADRIDPARVCGPHRCPGRDGFASGPDQSTRTPRCREQYTPLVALCLRHFLADSIICMCVFDFRQAQVVARRIAIVPSATPRIRTLRYFFTDSMKATRRITSFGASRPIARLE